MLLLTQLMLGSYCSRQQLHYHHGNSFPKVMKTAGIWSASNYMYIYKHTPKQNIVPEVKVRLSISGCIGHQTLSCDTYTQDYTYILMLCVCL